jgi:hypothetical protein
MAPSELIRENEPEIVPRPGLGVFSGLLDLVWTTPLGGTVYCGGRCAIAVHAPHAQLAVSSATARRCASRRRTCVVPGIA